MFAIFLIIAAAGFFIDTFILKNKGDDHFGERLS